MLTRARLLGKKKEKTVFDKVLMIIISQDWINFLNSKGLSSPFGGRQYRAAIGESLQPNINDFFLHNPAYRGPIFIDISGTISISEDYSEDIEMQEEE